MYQIHEGLGVAGYNPPVMWGVYIITFVFWVGIGHAGTLISAILYLFRAGFRTTIYRAAEAMTVFAVMTAGLFPIIHIGRPWKFFWLIPYPNWRLLFPNFKSPLVWDVFAISTYLTISVTFLFIGLLPDFATLRDAEKNPMKKRILGLLSFGWRNSENEWRHFARAYLFLAAFSTPLVLSVHSVVSFDFSMAQVPGWHTTIFAPYFVAGAIFSGMAMVLTLMLVARKAMGLEDYITHRHVDAMCKLIIATSGIVGLAYVRGQWHAGSGPMNFVRFSGELAIYYVLIALGGLVLNAFMFMMFRAIGFEPVVFATEWLLPCGAAGAVLVMPSIASVAPPGALRHVVIAAVGLAGGIAAAMAMGSAIVVPDKNVSVSFNVATYGGEQGIAGSVTGRVSDLTRSPSTSRNATPM